MRPGDERAAACCGLNRSLASAAQVACPSFSLGRPGVGTWGIGPGSRSPSLRSKGNPACRPQAQRGHRRGYRDRGRERVCLGASIEPAPGGGHSAGPPVTAKDRNLFTGSPQPHSLHLLDVLPCPVATQSLEALSMLCPYNFRPLEQDGHSCPTRRCIDARSPSHERLPEHNLCPLPPPGSDHEPGA